MNEHRRTVTRLRLGLAACGALLVAVSVEAAQDARHVGRASVYESLHDASLEEVSTPDAILAATRDNAAPMEVWRALEHGERVECLDCIPAVTTLLYDGHPRTREIAAWWLRRRVFGVFGPGEAYSRVVETLQSDESEVRRARAAEALGEFLVGAGAKHVARAIAEDRSPVVRESAVRALRRLNDEGPAGELALAIRDSFASVRVAGIAAASRINSVSADTISAIIEAIGDDNVEVRRTAAEVLGTMRITDAALGLAALSEPDREPDPEVRKAAVAAMGQLGDPVVREYVEAAMSDPDFLVRSAARVALRRL
jgi:HEAT repeat protein